MVGGLWSWAGPLIAVACTVHLWARAAKRSHASRISIFYFSSTFLIFAKRDIPVRLCVCDAYLLGAFWLLRGSEQEGERERGRERE